ncbi:MAG: hypothetical protein DMG40_13005 [Acidobacteria bacterium]|nr:MAG: hypothetical protein DMG40_13005 [Acidobacteriota bacterium]
MAQAIFHFPFSILVYFQRIIPSSEGFARLTPPVQVTTAQPASTTSLFLFRARCYFGFTANSETEFPGSYRVLRTEN